MTQRKTGQMVFVALSMFALFGIANNHLTPATDGEDRTEHIIALVMVGAVSTAGLVKLMIDENKAS